MFIGYPKIVPDYCPMFIPDRYPVSRASCPNPNWATHHALNHCNQLDWPLTDYTLYTKVQILVCPSSLGHCFTRYETLHNNLGPKQLQGLRVPKKQLGYYITSNFYKRRVKKKE